MKPRATDWALALLVSLLFATGMVSLVSGRTADAWVFALHGAGGAALGVVVGLKLRRVWGRLVRPREWERRTVAGLLATGLVALALGSGTVWSSGGDLELAGFNLMGWHIAVGIGLTLLVAVHAVLRGKPIRRRDVAHRRQFLLAAGLAGGAFVAWRLQRPASALVGWRGARRRFTGSYESGSFAGNAFPATSWVSDRPRPVAGAAYRLRVEGLVARPLELSTDEIAAAGDSLVATLDCTSGFYTTQRWHGVRLGRLIDPAGPAAHARHVRVISRTGYRWSYPVREARGLLLATRVGDEELSHEHGAPVRLVAPGRRGFEWVKWVARVELHDQPDPGAVASTVWSSLTPAGRGAA